MTLPSAGPLAFAPRATGMIAAACRLARRHVVLLPALFCFEVAEAIEAAGLAYRCYDVPPDLSDPWPGLLAALDGEVGAALTLHPFGLRRPVPAARPADVLLVEDACHALRSAWRDGAGMGRGDLVVYSPRKELGWDSGGVAGGARVADLGLSPAPAVAAAWNATDLGRAAEEGRRVTEAACAALGDQLPRVESGDVLLALPLLSRRRDDVIASLRAQGIGAWRWRRPLKGSGPRSTPGAWALRRRLLLVPLPTVPGPDLQQLLETVARAALEPWLLGRGHSVLDATQPLHPPPDAMPVRRGGEGFKER
jgi:hypothetical protein